VASRSILGVPAVRTAFLVDLPGSSCASCRGRAAGGTIGARDGARSDCRAESLTLPGVLRSAFACF
jgi:hypothetical protein